MTRSKGDETVIDPVFMFDLLLLFTVHPLLLLVPERGVDDVYRPYVVRSQYLFFCRIEILSLYHT